MAASMIARPAGSIRPSASSRTIRSLLVRAQPLPGLRRVNQSVDRSSSSVRPAESIHPTHSASSTATLVLHGRLAGRRLPRHQPRAGLGRVVRQQPVAPLLDASPRAPAGRRPCLPSVLLVVALGPAGRIVAVLPRRRVAGPLGAVELAFRRRELALVGPEGLLRGADLLVRDRGGLAGGGEPAAGLRERADQVVLLLVGAGGGLLRPGDLGGALVAGRDGRVVPAPAPRSPRARPAPTRPGPRRAPAARVPRGGVDGRAPRRTRRSPRSAPPAPTPPPAGASRAQGSPWPASPSVRASARGAGARCRRTRPRCRTPRTRARRSAGRRPPRGRRPGRPGRR